MAGTVTEFAVNDPSARKIWAKDLGVEVPKVMYFSKFMGSGDTSMIKVKRELTKQAGDQITMELRKKLSGDGIEGDNEIEGTAAEEGLKFFNDKVLIDQRRKGTKSKGKMSEQRVPFNIRQAGRDALSTWFGEDLDQELMMYMAGARGVNADFHFPIGWTGRAGNTLSAPSTNSQLYGGDATGKADLAADDLVTRELIEKLAAIVAVRKNTMQPFMVEGSKKFVFLMHEFQKFDLRNSMSDNDWLDLHKNTDGKDSPIYNGTLGELAGIVLHAHENVIRFNDYGSGAVKAARALLLGACSGVLAWGGSSDKNRYSWHEETDDRGNSLVITAGSIHGCKKTKYSDNKTSAADDDFSVIAVDTGYTSIIDLD
jgi:N4-gp56 family major capsid protein